MLRDLAADQARAVVIEITDRVLWLEDGRFRELAAMAGYPVCRMSVDPTDALSADHRGGAYWFCSAHCRDEFCADPVRFAA